MARSAYWGTAPLPSDTCFARLLTANPLDGVAGGEVPSLVSRPCPSGLQRSISETHWE